MDGKRTNVRDVRRRNRSVLLSKLYFDGTLSRQDLSERTGLSAASVSNLVAELIDEGVVEEAGSEESDGGRPRILLRVAPHFAHVVGIDVGETRVQVELFDLSMTALAKAEFPMDPGRPDPEIVVRHILAGLRQVAEESPPRSPDILGVGIGVNGVVEQGSEAVVHAQQLGWENIPLERMVRAGTDLPLYLDNGAKALGQAEMWFGGGRGARHAVIALVGSGVGAAVVTNGTSYRGATSSAGEWGHTTLMYGGRQCRCGSHGCLEAYVGAEAVLDRFQIANGGVAAAGKDEESALRALIEAVPTSPIAAQVMAETAGYLGAGIANLINLFNPERIVLGGWAGLAIGPELMPQIRAAAVRHALRQPMAQTTIEMCQLGSEAVAFGAATLPVANLLAAGGVRTVSRTRRLMARPASA